MKKIILLLSLWGLFIFLWISPYYRGMWIGQAYEWMGSSENAATFYLAALNTPEGMIQSGGKARPAEKLVELSAHLKVPANEELTRAYLALHQMGELHPELRPYAQTALEKLSSGVEEVSKSAGPADALKLVEEMGRLNAGSSVPLWLEARLRLGLQQSRRAVDLYLLCIEKEPLIESAVMDLARLLFRERRYTQVYTILERFSTRLQPSWELMSMLGLSAYETGRIVEAVKPLEQALAFRAESYEESLALGRIGARVNFPELAEHLLKAWKLAPNQVALAYEYLDFLILTSRHDQACGFYVKEADLLGKEGAERVLESAFAVQEAELIDQLVLRYPDLGASARISYFQGMMAFEERSYPEAAAILARFVEQPGASPARRIRALQTLAEIARILKQSSNERNWLTQLFQLDPSRSDLMLRVAETYTSEKEQLIRLKSLLDAVEWYPDQLDVRLETLKLLKDMGAWVRVLQLLQDHRSSMQSPQVGLYLVEAYLQMGEPQRATTLLERIESQHGEQQLEGTLAEIRDAAAMSRRLLEDPSKRVQALEAVYEKLEEQLKRVETVVKKNLLPPSISLAPKLQVRAMVSQPYVYKGEVRTRIPEGTSIPIMYHPNEARREEGWLMARYQNQMHSIHEKYLNIRFWPSDTGAMGQATVANLDDQYFTEAEIKESFRRGTQLEVLAGHRVAPEKMIQLDEENFISLISAPQQSWDVRKGASLYHYFERDSITLDRGLEFLNAFEFEDIRSIPSENRLVLFGPEGGGIHLLDVSRPQPDILFSASFQERQLTLRNQDRLQKPAYSGYTVIDLNRDDVLDYIALWQDRKDSMKGMLHILVSHNGVMQDLILPAELTPSKDNEVSEKVSPVRFLRDLDEDGMIELLLPNSYEVRNEPVSRVPFARFYQIQAGKPVDISARFPSYYRDLQGVIRTKIAEARIRFGEDGYPYRVLTESGLAALEEAEKLSGGQG